MPTLNSDMTNLTPEDEAVYDEIRQHALAIIKFITEPDDVIEMNRFLAELQPYPSWILRIEEVK